MTKDVTCNHYRWLKQKNQSRRAESREKIRKRQEDKEEMKTVLHNIKTRSLEVTISDYCCNLPTSLIVMRSRNNNSSCKYVFYDSV